MQYRAESLGLVGHVTTLLMDLIHDQLGLQYKPSDAEQLGDRLAPLVVARGLSSFMDYYYVLKYSPGPDDWLDGHGRTRGAGDLLWREIDQLRAVVDHLVPSLVRASRGRPVRIWSSACASGEEPLTLAMLLEEAGWFERAPIELIASDASPAAIARARKGDYTQRSFRNLPVALKDKYFVANENQWSVSSRVASSCEIRHRESRRRGPGRTICVGAGHHLSQRVHLLLRSQHSTDGDPVQPGDAVALVPLCGRLGIAAPADATLRPAGDRRRVRLREGLVRRVERLFQSGMEAAS
jgi:chemotaxis methyl-accepting protein methylase